MPDDHGMPGPDPSADDHSGESRPRRRRRSMDTYGGISVSDVVQRHTGQRPLPDVESRGDTRRNGIEARPAAPPPPPPPPHRESPNVRRPGPAAPPPGRSAPSARRASQRGGIFDAPEAPPERSDRMRPPTRPAEQQRPVEQQRPAEPPPGAGRPSRRNGIDAPTHYTPISSDLTGRNGHASNGHSANGRSSNRHSGGLFDSAPEPAAPKPPPSDAPRRRAPRRDVPTNAAPPATPAAPPATLEPPPAVPGADRPRPRTDRESATRAVPPVAGEAPTRAVRPAGEQPTRTVRNGRPSPPRGAGVAGAGAAGAAAGIGAAGIGAAGIGAAGIGAAVAANGAGPAKAAGAAAANGRPRPGANRRPRPHPAPGPAADAKAAAGPADAATRVTAKPNAPVEPESAETPDTEAKSAVEALKKSPQTRLQEKKVRKNDQTVKAGRIAAISFAVIVFLITGGLWGMKTWYNGKFNEIAALDENSADIHNAAGQLGDENFLIAGSDTRAGATKEDGVGDVDAAPGARSDSLMIAHIPKDRKRAVVVGFPRDLEVSRPECARWDSATGEYSDEMVPAEDNAKLNSAFAVGGPRCTTKLIQQMTGMKINHFVGIDFHGFKDMIDVVAGVPLHFEKPIIDETLGAIVPQAGDVTISGDQALNYVRARHVKGDVTSDYGRIKRQQEVIGALLKKTLSPDVILNPGKLNGMVNAFAAATFGDNIGIDQMLTLGQSMQGLDSSKVQFQTVPTTGEANKRGNEVLLKETSGSLFRSLIENSPLPSDEPPASAPVEQAKPVR